MIFMHYWNHIFDLVYATGNNLSVVRVLFQVCKFFLEAVEKKQYGWFWECPNGGKNCHYRHALPPGYVLKSQMKALLEEESNKISIEEEIENQVICSFPYNKLYYLIVVSSFLTEYVIPFSVPKWQLQLLWLLSYSFNGRRRSWTREMPIWLPNRQTGLRTTAWGKPTVCSLSFTYESLIYSGFFLNKWRNCMLLNMFWKKELQVITKSDNLLLLFC